MKVLPQLLLLREGGREGGKEGGRDDIPACSSCKVIANEGPPPAFQSFCRSCWSAGKRSLAAARRRASPISAVGGAL